jgi:uncharacterized membrane protein YheB (UPF0754 family)
MNLSYFIIPVVSGFTGWFSTWIAIKMLFHPKNPVRFLGMTIQGVFPKNQALLAEKLGKVVAQDLISFDDIKSKLVNPEMIAKVMPHIRTRLDGFIKTKLTEKMPILSMFIGNNTLDEIKESMVQELGESLPEILSTLGEEMRDHLNIENIVAEKVNNFSSDRLEQILNDVMKKEFQFLEIIGAVIGVFIGIIQVIFNAVAQ